MGRDSPPTGINPGDDVELSLDVAFDALADPHRRAVLAVLDRQAGPLPVDAVVEAVVDRTGGHHCRVAATLHHAHLPKLDAAGLVTYDDEACTVAAGATLDSVGPLLALVADDCPDGRRG